MNRQRRFLQLVSLIILVAAAEIVSRFVIRSDWALETTPLISDTRWMLSWQKRYKQKLTEYAIDAFDPMLGWVPLAGTHNARIGNGTVNINADGIRGSKTYEKTKPEGIRRIVVVGDSFTFGEGVNDDETYPHLLEGLLPDTEVINMGVHGYGLDQMTLRLDTAGFAYHPDIVLYAFIKDDMDRSLLKFRDYMKPAFVIGANGLTLTNVPIEKPEHIEERFRRTPAIFSAVRLLWDRFVFRGDHNRNTQKLVIAIWNKTVADIRSNGAIPVFLYLPDEIDYDPSAFNYPEWTMLAYCRSAQITCFSALPYLEQAMKDGSFNGQEHFSAETNRIVARGLARDLLSAFPILSAQNRKSE